MIRPRFVPRRITHIHTHTHNPIKKTSIIEMSAYSVSTAASFCSTEWKATDDPSPTSYTMSVGIDRFGTPSGQWALSDPPGMHGTPSKSSIVNGSVAQPMATNAGTSLQATSSASGSMSSPDRVSGAPASAVSDGEKKACEWVECVPRKHRATPDEYSTYRYGWFGLGSVEAGACIVGLYSWLNVLMLECC